MINRTYSLNKSRKVLHWTYSWFKNKGKDLTPHNEKKIENTLRDLEDAVFDKNRKKANKLAHKAEEFSTTHFKKSWGRYIFDVAIAIVFALIIATVVRQTWFELYEIPTGSMRPSFKEQDRLSVTKTAFGINVPLQTDHFYFDKDLVKRGKVVIFSGDNIDLPDTDTTYFGIIPYKKRYIKRLIGKPGDTLYFYGGEIYGIDKEGNAIDVLLNDPWMKKNEHIPFLSFEGDVASPSQNEILFKQMNIPLGKLQFLNFGSTIGKVFNGKEWIQDNPYNSSDDQKIQTYGDLWGIKNFGMARLLTKEQLKTYTETNTSQLADAPLYLQIKHSPNLTYPKAEVLRERGYSSVHMPTFESVIPLSQKHLDTIMNGMYTARFEVKGGRPKRYSASNRARSSKLASFKGIADGTYEFYHGIAEKIGFKGKTTKLPASHPFYSTDPEHVQELFNMGIDLYGSMSEEIFYKLFFPHRYVYFRDGNLYLMGSKVLEKDDPALKAFVVNENEKENRSTKSIPYIAFRDNGAPTIETIKTFGLTIPEKYYLVLGDNHAMSADSRVFGFVPQGNLEGAPSLLIWPPGDRWGFPPQTPYPIFNIPRTVIWMIAGTIFLLWYIWHRKKMQTRLFGPKDET